jgi:hypothetical protein
MIKKIISIGLLCSIWIYAENNSYLKLGMQKINDQIDIFNIKASEINQNTDNYDHIGDMQGFSARVNYTLGQDYTVKFNLDQKDIDYLSQTLTNNHLNVSLEKKIFDHENFTFGVMGGYEYNRANDFKIKDLGTINYLIDKFYPAYDVDISKVGDKYWATMIERGAITTILEKPLSVSPYGKLQNAQDQAFFIGATIDPKIENLPFDLQLFTSLKQIKIEKSYVTSLTEETDATILAYMNDHNLSDRFDLSRTDRMLALGFSIDYDFNDLFSVEFKYQINRMFRDAALEDDNEETNYNHIVDIEFDYALNEKWSLYLSGTAMSNQFNGVIPYLYDQYTNSTFDHKYGWAEVGLIYSF